MFFIRCGGAIAWALVVLGALRTAIGIFAAVSDGSFELPEIAERFLSLGASGAAMQEGLMLFSAGIVLGLLVQIAKGVKFD